MSEPASQKLAFVKICEMKIIRRKYRIGFRTGTTAGDLINTIRLLPALAIVDDVETDDDGITTITFHEEVVEK